jgi:hypothetical protein
MTNVHRITPHLRDVDAPAAIRDLPAWVIWRFEAVPGNGKPRKVPYYATGGKRHGEQGAPQDVTQLVTFDAAKAAAARRGFDGVGFATLQQFGICALDFDNCITDGKIHPDVEALLVDTYAEFSPSGQGLRLFFKGDLGNGKALRDGAFGMECFSTRGFVTFTGNTLELTELLGNDDTVAPVNDDVRALHRERFARSKAETVEVPASAIEPAGLTEAQLQDLLAQLDPDMNHDDWLHVGMGLHHETQGEGFLYWDDWSAGSSKYPGSEALRQRWDSFGRHNDRAVTIRTAMKLAGMNPSGPASADEFEELVAEADIVNPISDDEQPAQPRYTFEPVHAFSSAMALPWIVKGVLPKAGLAVVYGASGSGKSFAVLDIAFAIARGVEWRGRRVRQGRVAYIAAEGAEGFRKRLAAYAKHFDVDLTVVPMTVLNASPNLMEKQDAVDIVRGIRAAGGADVVIVDTFAQTTPGANENAGEDVGKALAHCKRIHETTGALVVLIHHSGKDASKGARGWSGLRAAADAEIEILREGDARSLRLSKNKDGEDGLLWGFALETVQLGVDEDMDPITSCVVVEAQASVVGAGPARKLGPVEVIVNAVIQEFAQAQTDGIEVGPVLAEAVKRMDPPADGKRDSRKQRARRAIEALCNGDTAPYWLGDDGCISVC